MDVATFYRFVRIDAPTQLALLLRRWTAQLCLKGTILLASEGINATLAGSAEALRVFIERLGHDRRFGQLVVRTSRGDSANPIFYRMKVRVRAEIVALKCADIDPSRRTGTHVDAATWNQLLDDPDVLVVDARNRYEIALGTFPGAVDPGTRSFREFPQFAAGLDRQRQRRVALFCTGGIRCEKASAYLLETGVGEVYQLDGGILNYLAEVGTDNRFEGECFVFDQRVSVSDALDQGDYTLCHACRQPLAEADTRSPDYVLDVSCPTCIGRQTAAQRAAFGERARQVQLAAARGERHIGAPMSSLEGQS
jgi:UPF0176 protein